MSDLEIHLDGNLLRVTLNRPDHMNAMSRDMIHGLRDAVMDVTENKTARAILITGAGRGFCAGADLQGDGLAKRREVVEGQMMAGVNKLIAAIRECPVPVVIGLNGAAAGAGCGLALAGDIMIAGIGDYDIASHIYPSLTSAQMPRYEIGKRAGELMMARIAGEKVKENVVILDTPLIVRESTGK